MTTNFFKNTQPTKRLDTAGKLAIAFIGQKIDGYMDEIEVALRSKDGSYVWDRAAVKKIFGQQLALAYAFGYLDKREK